MRRRKRNQPQWLGDAVFCRERGEKRSNGGKCLARITPELIAHSIHGGFGRWLKVVEQKKWAYRYERPHEAQEPDMKGYGQPSQEEIWWTIG
jgi:hypothetical protein